MITFFRNLVGVKKDQAVTSAVEALVRWDPQAATEAELRTMEQHLDELGRQVAQARQGYDRERKEADAIQALSRQRMAAAEQLHLLQRPRRADRGRYRPSHLRRVRLVLQPQDLLTRTRGASHAAIVVSPKRLDEY